MLEQAASQTDRVGPPGDPEDFEVRVHVDFENRLIRPLSVSGVSVEDATSEILVFARDRCHPDCASDGCKRCRPRKLYQGLAGNPRGVVAYAPHCEYLYCLRLHRRQPARAILSLTPREQNVEVRELGLLAYWFATWIQRAKAGDVGDPGRWAADDADVEAGEDSDETDSTDSDYNEEAPRTPSEVVAAAIAQAIRKGGIVRKPSGKKKPRATEEKPAAEEAALLGLEGAEPAEAPAPAAYVPSLLNLNSSNKYLPNLRIVYHVKQERMSIAMPEPSQLTRDIDVILAKSQDAENIQMVTLSPGMAQASQELVVARDSAHTLMVRFRDSGSPLTLLDLVTEKKVLRVQESLLAPKHMNFLMERRVDQRATFVLHITFDEKGVAVEKKPLGEFYLDVDFDKNTLNIGTVPGNEKVAYKVEELLGPNQSDWTKARKVLWFEGAVDPATLFIQNPVSIHTMADYLITVINPDSGLELPTSVLCIGTKSLYVKEVKGSDVRLHVTVQRQFDPALQAVTNASNCLDTAASHVLNSWTPMPVRRCQPDGAFHCPIGAGGTRYRILHNAGVAAAGPATSAAATATEGALLAADTSCHSNSGGGGGGGGGGASCDDSGFVRNHSSPSGESLDSLAAQCQHRRRMHRREVSETATTDEDWERQPDFNVNLDVDLPRLQARLLPGGNSDSGSGCYLIVEDSLSDTRSRSIPCQLGQSFSVQRWCRYTVKVIGDTCVTPLFTFCVTDTDVTDIKPCNPTVRLSENVCQR